MEERYILATVRASIALTFLVWGIVTAWRDRREDRLERQVGKSSPGEEAMMDGNQAIHTPPVPAWTGTRTVYAGNLPDGLGLCVTTQGDDVPKVMAAVRMIVAASRMVGLLDALASLALAFAMQDDSGYAGKPEEYPLYKEIEAIRADLEGPGGASPAAEPQAEPATTGHDQAAG
jgi:hypothetical protein